MFDEIRVSQMAAYLLSKQRGRTTTVLKLMKLLYLSDRESLSRYGMPISGDKMVSMPHGPVLSCTLNLMNGDTRKNPDGWLKWVSKRKDNDVRLKHTIDITDPNCFDRLSEATIEILDDVHNEYGEMSAGDLSNFTHTLSEWENPRGSSKPIHYRDIFYALGQNTSDSEKSDEYLQQQELICALFSEM